MVWKTVADLEGAPGRSIVDAKINSAGHMIVTYDDGSTQDAGYARGKDGLPGVGAIPADNAVAGYLNASSSASRAALDTAVGELVVAPGAFRDALEEDFAGRDDVVVLATDFGVVADGTTVNTTALQAALNAAQSTFGVAGVVQLPTGVIRSAPFTIPDRVALRGAGKGATVIEHTGGGSWLVSAQGTVTPSVTTLTATALPGATQINVVSTAGIQVGDILVLRDNVSYTTTDAGYKSGEQLRVKSIDSGTQLSVWGCVRGSWATPTGGYTTANSATVSRLNMRRGLAVSDLTLRSSLDGLTGLLLAQFVTGVTLTNVEVDGGGQIGVRFDGCRDVTVTGYTCRDLTDDIGALHAGYGIAVSGPSENVTITGGSISRVRHGFTTMGGQYGMPHNVTISGLSVSEVTLTGIDTHAAGDGILITGNNVIGCGGGISIRSRNTVVGGNLVAKTLLTHGISCTEANCKNVTVKGNVVMDVYPQSHGIAAGAPVEGLHVEENTVINVGADGIYIDAGSTLVTIARNTVRNVGMNLTGRTHIRPGMTTGSGPATSGWTVVDNLCLQDAGVGSAARAVDTLSSGLTGAVASGNKAAGTYSLGVFNVPAATSSRNVKIDATPPAVSGSRGGNAALNALLNELAVQGVITNSTTA